MSPEAFRHLLNTGGGGMEPILLRPLPGASQLHREQEACTVHVSDDLGMCFLQLLKPSAKMRAHRRRTLHEPLRLEDADRLPRRRAPDGMAAERETVVEAFLAQSGAPGSFEDRCAEGRVSARESLREDDGVGRKPDRLGAEPPSRPPEARDDLVGNELEAVPVAQLLEALREGARHRHRASDAHDRFEDDAGEGSRPATLERLLDSVQGSLIGQVPVVRGLPRVIGGGHMDAPRAGIAVGCHPDAGEILCDKGVAVVALLERKDVLTTRDLASGADGGLDRIRATDPVEGRREMPREHGPEVLR